MIHSKKCIYTYYSVIKPTIPTMKLVYTFVLTLLLIHVCNGQSKLHPVEPCTVISLCDRSGNTWFCTGSGVYVYNGKSLVHYTEKDGLSSNRVYCILEDHAGTIWLGTENGVCCYDRNHFIRFFIPGLDDSLSFHAVLNSPADSVSTHSIRCMLEDKTGNIWFGSESKGLFCYTKCYFIHFSYNNSYWEITSGNSLINLAFAYKVNSNKTYQPPIQSLLEDKGGYIWFNSPGAAYGGKPEYSWLDHDAIRLYRFDKTRFIPINK